MKILSHLQPGDLPELLRDGLTIARNDAQRDMLMLSLLTASGYAMPHYYMRTGLPARRYEPSLMTLVVAPPASGKGIMNLGRRILQPLHERLRHETEEAMAMAMSREEQEAVPQLMALIPGNCTSNALLQILQDNDGRGCILETEMDIVSQIWHRDYGNYSALLRQAFEHEAVSKARKTRTDAYLEVKHPALSVLLSGTANQLQPLLESRENGLASRFICYVAEELIPFDKEAIIRHDEQPDTTADETLDRLGRELLRLNDWLSSQRTECEWRLRPEQAEELRGCFSDNYLLTLFEMGMPTSFDPVVKRLAVSVQRIGMILSMLRYWDTTVREQLDRGEDVKLPAVLECDDRDFRTVEEMAYALIGEAIAVHSMLPEEGGAGFAIADDPAAELLAALPEQFTAKEAIEAGRKIGRSERRVRDYIKQLADSKAIVKIKHGQYQKV